MTDPQFLELKGLLERILDQVQGKPKPAKVQGVSTQSDEDWIKSLETDPAFTGIDVKRELAKAQVWCKTNNRKFTRRFFVGTWLMRADRTVQVQVKPDLPPVMTKVLTPLPKGEAPPKEVAEKLSKLLGKTMSF